MFPGEPITPGMPILGRHIQTPASQQPDMASPQMDAIPTCDGDYDWLLLDLLMHERSAGLEPAISTLPSIFRGDFSLALQDSN